MKFESADVARYYDQNTASFLSHGQGGAHGIIHRAVWGEGVLRREQAFHFVHDLLQARIADGGAQRILDLGCGVGASLEYILRGKALSGFGVTNSAVQAQLARERLGDRASIAELDFCSAPLPAPIDLAFGIESFAQAPDAAAFFENVAKSLAAGGYLVLCDDFLADFLMLTRLMLTRLMLTRLMMTRLMLTRLMLTRLMLTRLMTRLMLTRLMLTRLMLTRLMLTRLMLTRLMLTRLMLTRLMMTRLMTRLMLMMIDGCASSAVGGKRARSFTGRRWMLLRRRMGSSSWRIETLRRFSSSTGLAIGCSACSSPSHDPSFR